MAVAVYSTVDSPNSWILPSIITSCSHIYPHHWDAVPSTTNGGESQHHWTNTQTSTRLTLLEAIALFVILPYLTCHHSLDFSIERTKSIEKPPMSFATHSSNEHKSTLTMTFSTACLETLSGVQILLKKRRHLKKKTTSYPSFAARLMMKKIHASSRSLGKRSCLMNFHHCKQLQ
jgi:hypothetical protein